MEHEVKGSLANCLLFDKLTKFSFGFETVVQVLMQGSKAKGHKRGGICSDACVWPNIATPNSDLMVDE